MQTNQIISTVLSAPSVVSQKVTILEQRSAIGELIRSIITADPDRKDPFYVLDLGVVADLYRQWTQYLPSIRPFYAVKCNPNPSLLGTLAALGAAFDCASAAEIDAVLTLGVSPESIIYANPCKPVSHIKHAAGTRVGLTTFDSVHELEKIRSHHPNCCLLLRLKPPDEAGARRPLGTKYGALPEEVSPLLLAARSTGLAVIGVSFHVGSSATNPATYRAAIGSSRGAFDAAERLGGPRMRVLDVGGGFSAGGRFEKTAEVIMSAIGEHFGDWPELEVIAEPGRFFSETALTLATSIIGKRVRGEGREYWINDGIHGSMSCIKNNTADVTMMPLDLEDGEAWYPSTVFGPTCDAMDMVATGQRLPEMKVGEWLVSPNMGAYTCSMGSSFNGFFTSAIQTHLAYSNHHYS